MIMAAGLGTRLGSITQSTPKALVRINGKTILRLAVENCTRHGFDDIIINVHHFAGMVEEEVRQLNKSGFRVTVSDEREMLLENGGGLYKARDFFNEKPFLVCNVDIISDLNLSDLYRYHLKTGGMATLAVRHRPGKRFLLVNREGRLKGWCNKATGEKILTSDDTEELSEIAFSSMQIINPEIFSLMKEGIYTLITLYLQLASSCKISTFTHDDGYWFDIGTPENLQVARDYFS